MANKLIIGSSISKYKKGYPTEVNSNKINTFTAKEDIAFGTFLAVTDEFRLYTGVQAGSQVVTDAKKIVGVSMSTNAKQQAVYPAVADSVGTKTGERGDCINLGTVAVSLLTGSTTPKELDAVYLVTAASDESQIGSVRAGATALYGETSILLENFVFTGEVDTDLAVVKKVY